MAGKESKPHIGIYGRRNNGKSSLINCLTGQDTAIVSTIAGTTTDPVKKSIEIPGIGPAIIIDTAGIDDIGELGSKRVSKTLQSINTIDFALLVITHNLLEEEENRLIEEFKKCEVPYLIVHNKSDLEELNSPLKEKEDIIDFSCINPGNKERLIQKIRDKIPPSAYSKSTIIGDLIKHGDIVLLITPIDIEAPEGRLILPQVQTIRDILDNDAVAIVLKEREVDHFLKSTGIKPAMVITDSQAFPKAAAAIPDEIPLTSFSIVLARLKGDFENYMKGTEKIAHLKNGDRILMLESCTHHVSCDDIGRVKIPRWISNFTGKELKFDVVAGLDSIERPLEEYALIIQCGGCVVTRKQLMNRLQPAVARNIAITNYGMAIAFVHGIYRRAIKPFRKSESTQDYL